MAHVSESISDADLDRVAVAVAALEPEPRRRRWVSVTFCVLDAVWSIGSRYDSTVVPVVKRVADDFGVQDASVPNAAPVSEDPVPLQRFLRAYDVESLTNRTNRQRTSTSGGALKAEAALAYAQILVSHDIETIDDARRAITDPALFKRVEADLRGVPGDGSHGIRRGYFWMLVGDASRVKPDRMVLRWFASQQLNLNPDQAAHVIAQVVERLHSISGGSAVTAWEVDHAIWNAGRRLPAVGRGGNAGREPRSPQPLH